MDSNSGKSGFLSFMAFFGLFTAILVMISAVLAFVAVVFRLSCRQEYVSLANVLVSGGAGVAALGGIGAKVFETELKKLLARIS